MIAVSIAALNGLKIYMPRLALSSILIILGLHIGNYIDQSLVYGDNKPYLVALLVLNSEIDINEKNLSDEIEKINKNLTKIEKIKKFFVIKEKFSIENGMMTPTLKLKRYKIINIYKNNFEDLYKK